MNKKTGFSKQNNDFYVFLHKVKSFLIRKIFLMLPQAFKMLIAKKINYFKSNNIDEVINFTFNTLGETIRPEQIKEEFRELLKLITNNELNTILEIGTANGGSLFSFCKLASVDATIISIDLPQGMFGGGYPDWKIPIYNLFKSENQDLFLLREDSHSIQTYDKILKILNGKKLSFLFLDGDHTYDGTKNDFNMYSNLVKKGGIIAFHDIAPNGIEERVGGVPIFWNEIKLLYNYKEFINDHKQTGYGIGCLFV